MRQKMISGIIFLLPIFAFIFPQKMVKYHIGRDYHRDILITSQEDVAANEVILLFTNVITSHSRVHDFKCRFILPPNIELYKELLLPDGESYSNWYKELPEFDWEETNIREKLECWRDTEEGECDCVILNQMQETFAWPVLDYSIPVGESRLMMFNVVPRYAGVGRIQAEITWRDDDGRIQTVVEESGLITTTVPECIPCPSVWAIGFGAGMGIPIGYDGYYKNGLSGGFEIKRMGFPWRRTSLGLKLCYNQLNEDEKPNLITRAGLLTLEYELLEFLAPVIAAGYFNQDREDEEDALSTFGGMAGLNVYIPLTNTARIQVHGNVFGIDGNVNADSDANQLIGNISLGLEVKL